MKKHLTELVFILDRSGSMAGLVDDTIGGFNSMLDEQREAEGEVLVSTVLFSDESHVVHDRLPLDQVPHLNRRDYRPAGSTALLDAVGDAVKHIRTIHRYARAEDVPARTLFVITTDGMENASRRYTGEQVRRLITERKAAGWEFIFLGANIDAITTAGSLGIGEDRAVNFHADGQGARASFRSVNCAVRAAVCNAPMTSAWKDEAEADFEARSTP